MKILKTDASGNKLGVQGAQIKLLLSERGESRVIGLFDPQSGILEVERDPQRHLFRKGNAYGINDEMLRLSRVCHTLRISLISGRGRSRRLVKRFDVPIEWALENGRYLNFKQQGFERQIFLSMEQLEGYVK